MILIRIFLMPDDGKYTFAYLLCLVYLLYEISTQIFVLFLTGFSFSKYQISFKIISYDPNFHIFPYLFIFLLIMLSALVSLL